MAGHIPYHFYLSFDAGSTYAEIIPKNWPKFQTILESQNADFRWCYRTNFNSDIKINQKLNSTIYATLAAWFVDNTKFSTKILIQTYRGNNITGTLYHSGFFSIDDCKIQKETGVISVTPFTDDAYQAFDNIADTQYNLLPSSYSGDILYQLADPDPPGVVWVNNSGLGFSSYSANAGLIYTAHNIPAQSISSAESYIPYILNGVPVNITISGMSGSPPKIRLVTGNSYPYTAVSNVITAMNGTYDLTPNADYAFVYIQVYYIFSDGLSSFTNLTMVVNSLTYSELYYSKAQTLKGFLEKLIGNSSYMDLPYTGKIKSTFLWNDALPSADIPPTIAAMLGSHPTWNYVTGAVNLLNYLIISSRYQWIPAGTLTTGQYYFRDIMASLNGFLDCFWFIDSDGNFRIEHEYWFRNLRINGSIDLTIAGFIKYKPEVDTKEISFDKSKIYSREHWVNSFQVSYDFIGVDIIYDYITGNKNSNERRNSIICTDLLNLLTLSGSADGFLLMNCDCLDPSLGTKFIERSETGKLSGVSKRNGHMAMANLHDKYWRYERYQKTGYLNNALTTFATVKPNNVQNVKFPYVGDIDFFQNIITSQGDGMIRTCTRDTDTDFLQVELLYDSM